MRIAVMVLSLLFTLPICLQTVVAAAAGDLANDSGLANGAAVGALVLLLYVLGGAFALGVPKISMICFAAAAACGIAGGTTTTYADLIFWGVVAAILALLSYLGVREKRRHLTSRWAERSA